jgi:hypothetical protein
VKYPGTTGECQQSCRVSCSGSELHCGWWWVGVEEYGAGG